MPVSVLICSSARSLCKPEERVFHRLAFVTVELVTCVSNLVGNNPAVRKARLMGLNLNLADLNSSILSQPVGLALSVS